MKPSKIKNFILDLLFPKKCLGCGKANIYICDDCFNKIEISQNNTCFFCGKITWQGRICLECKKENHLDRVISATEYANPLIRELIKSFKYYFAQELAIPLSKLLIKTLNNWLSDIGYWNFLLVPIPLHKRREKFRGFNQAELLAREIADYFKIPVSTHTLKRKLHTYPQAKIKDMEKRKMNLENIFEINSEKPVVGKTIILIDDVITTGATLIGAAKILKQSGAKEVWAITVAKG
jgi:ComF family protein